jgi:hypothetical protein
MYAGHAAYLSSLYCAIIIYGAPRSLGFNVYLDIFGVIGFIFLNSRCFVQYYNMAQKSIM